MLGCLLSIGRSAMETLTPPLRGCEKSSPTYLGEGERVRVRVARVLWRKRELAVSRGPGETGGRQRGG